MKNIKIGNMNASAVSLGCMRMSNLDKSQIDSIMDTALENGINFFDHADIYGGGNSFVCGNGFLRNDYFYSIAFYKEGYDS